MEKIDRLDWAVGLRVIAYGRRIGIRISRDDPQEIRRACDLLPPDARPAGSRGVDQIYSVLIPRQNPHRTRLKRFCVAYSGPATLVKSIDPRKVWEALEADLELHVAETARRRVFVHAGVVEWGNKAIVLPGKTFAGKTSLVQALARRGARFYSDEFALFDERGRVHPYPKPLSIRSGEGGSAKRRHPYELGFSVGRKPVQVGFVLSTCYRANATLRPKQLTAGQGVLELLSNAASARSRPQKTLQILQRGVDGVEIWKGVRGEADQAAEKILEMMM